MDERPPGVFLHRRDTPETPDRSGPAHASSTSPSLVIRQFGLGWQYKDSKGEIQGPFPTKKILRWAQLGYFNAETELRCIGTWTTLGMVQETLEDIEAGAATRVDAGPPSKPPAVEPARAPVAESARPTPTAPALTGVDLANKLFWYGKGTWRYIDQNDNTQGPFTSENMIEWYTANYFEANIYMCGSDASVPVNVVPPRAFFRPLGQLEAAAQRGAPVPLVSIQDVSGAHVRDERLSNGTKESFGDEWSHRGAQRGRGRAYHPGRQMGL